MDKMTTTDMARLVASRLPVMEDEVQEYRELVAFISLPTSTLKQTTSGDGWVYSGDDVQAVSSTLYGLFNGIRRKNYHVTEQALSRQGGVG